MVIMMMMMTMMMVMTMVMMCVRTSEVRDRLNVVRRRCAEMTVLSSKESPSRPSADNIRSWSQSLDLLLADKCQSHRFRAFFSIISLALLLLLLLLALVFPPSVWSREV